MKLSENKLKELIEQEVSEALPFMSQGVSDVVTGNFIYDGIQVVGGLLLSLLAIGAVKVYQIKQDLDEKARKNVIAEKEAAHAKKVADMVEKYKDNEELISLLRSKKLKLFSKKLAELESSGGGNVGKRTASDVYYGSKKKHGIEQQ